jgi:lipopolysaccharide export LptBFGC system permease protein LptF
MSNRLKAVLAMLIYLLGNSVFFGALFSGNPKAILYSLAWVLIAQAAGVYLILLVRRTE